MTPKTISIICEQYIDQLMPISHKYLAHILQRSRTHLIIFTQTKKINNRKLTEIDEIGLKTKEEKKKVIKQL